MSRVDDLIANGFVQVSRRYRMLARVPLGKTPLEALEDADPHAAAQLVSWLNDRARAMYVRVYAEGENRVELSDEEFLEFLGKTGRVPVLSDRSSR